MREDLVGLPDNRSANVSLTFAACRFVAVVVALLAWMGPATESIWGQGNEAPEAQSFDREALDHFEQHVRPLLVERCFSCHSSKAQKGNLRLDSRVAILHGGDSGPAVEVGQAETSLLISAVKHESLEMPPEQPPLEDQQIQALEQWINNGVAWPDDIVLSASPITDADRSYWAFQPIGNPPPPAIANDEWSRTAVDRFVLAKLREQGMSPAPQADRATLVRRVYLDMLGVPPSAQVLQEFLEDRAPDAYERLVERVLASPAYGERWGRHWLDLVRYAESDGFRQDAYRTNAWHYRDYVIQSLNADKPYDEFAAEQLAGDELWHDDPSRWVGTSYLRLHLYEYNQRDARTQRQDILDEITEVTADVFLALGFRCARCHDHKYDPILQSDYFKLQAFFAALVQKDSVPWGTPKDLEHYERQQHEWETATQAIREEMANILKPHRQKARESAIFKFPPDLQKIAALSPSKRSPEEIQLAYYIDRQIQFEYDNIKLKGKDAERMKALQAELDKYQHLRPSPLPRVDSVAEAGAVAPDVVIPGDKDAKPLAPGYPEVFGDRFPDPLPCPTSCDTTGRRAELARWLMDERNPLTARVMANRLWQYHFGRGLVATSSDFGRLGGGPSHPELLDWLASRLIASDWRWKPLHRLLLNSATYRQAAWRDDLAACEARDPDNLWYWRYSPQRLTAEQLRDSMLSVSGQLDHRQGGPSVGADQPRRSVYLRVVRNTPHPFLALFDGADGINSTARRNSTTTATQALTLMNDGWVLGIAEKLATQWSARWDVADTAWMEHAYRCLYAREPDAHEIERIQAYIQASCDSHMPDEEIMADVCHVLLISNEFLYMD